MQGQYSYDEGTDLPTPFSEKERHFAKEESTFTVKQQKHLGILTTVSNSDWGGQAPGRNSASHKPGNPVTAIYKLHLWLSHDVQNKCMSWWRSKLDSSVELQTSSLSDHTWKHKWHDKGHRNTVRRTHFHFLLHTFSHADSIHTPIAAQCFAAFYKQPLKSSNKPSFQYIVSSVFFTNKIKARKWSSSLKATFIQKHPYSLDNVSERKKTQYNNTATNAWVCRARVMERKGHYYAVKEKMQFIQLFCCYSLYWVHMAIHKLSPVFPLKFLWLTFLEGVYHGRFGPRQHKKPEEKTHLSLAHVTGIWKPKKTQRKEHERWTRERE